MPAEKTLKRITSRTCGWLLHWCSSTLNASPEHLQGQPPRQ